MKKEKPKVPRECLKCSDYRRKLCKGKEQNRVCHLRYYALAQVR